MQVAVDFNPILLSPRQLGTRRSRLGILDRHSGPVLAMWQVLELRVKPWMGFFNSRMISYQVQPQFQPEHDLQTLRQGVAVRVQR